MKKLRIINFLFWLAMASALDAEVYNVWKAQSASSYSIVLGIVLYTGICALALVFIDMKLKDMKK